MSSGELHRFVRGYAAGGYGLIASSEGFPPEVMSACLDEFERWELAPVGTALVMVPLRVRSRLDGWIALASRLVEPEQGRAYRETACAVYLDRTRGEPPPVHALFRAVPGFDAQGVIPTEVLSHPQENLAELLPRFHAEAVRRAFAHLFLNEPVRLAAVGRQQEIEFAGFVTSLLPAPMAQTMVIGLGLGARGSATKRRRGLFQWMDNEQPAVPELDPRVPPATVASSTSLLERWFHMELAPRLEDPVGVPEHDLRVFWKELAQETGAQADVVDQALLEGRARTHALAESVVAEQAVESLPAATARKYLLSIAGSPAEQLRFVQRLRSPDGGPASSERISRLERLLPQDDPASSACESAFRLIAALQFELDISTPSRGEGRFGLEVGLRPGLGYGQALVEEEYWLLAGELLGRLAALAPQAFAEALQTPWTPPPGTEHPGFFERLRRSLRGAPVRSVADCLRALDDGQHGSAGFRDISLGGAGRPSKAMLELLRDRWGEQGICRSLQAFAHAAYRLRGPLVSIAAELGALYPEGPAARTAGAGEKNSSAEPNS